MRHLPHVLLVLYGLGGIVFAAWAVLGADAAPDSRFALPLPAAAMWAAAAGNLALAAGIARRVAVTRPIAGGLHTAIAIVAVVATGQHVVAGDAGPATYAEMAAKCGVHAAVACCWWRAAVLRTWFQRPDGPR